MLLFYGPMLLVKIYKRIKSNRFLNLLIFYIMYAVLITLLFLFLIPVSDKHLVSGGFFKNEGRYLYQIGLFLITVNLIIWPIYVIKTEEELFKVFKIIVYSDVVLAIFGIIQELSIRIANYNPFPIHRITGFDYEGGYLRMYGTEAIHRMQSLAGEPKHLAMALVIGIIIIILYRLNGKKIIRYDLITLAMFFICLVFTYSTTGYIWFGVAMAMIIVLHGFKLLKNPIVLLIVISIAMVLTYSYYNSIEGELAPYILKTINRASLEVQDKAVFDFFKNKPFYAITGLGLGNIHFYAENYLPTSFPLFRDTPFKGNSGTLLLLGDVGIIGMIILTFFVFGLIQSNSRFSVFENKEKATECKICIYFTIIVSVLFLSRYYEFFFIALGIMLYMNNNYRWKKLSASRNIPSKKLFKREIF
jgi:hypothetical protein